MAERMEAKGKFHFMGTHDLELIADVEWAEDGMSGSMTGCGKLKMLKWLTYDFAPGANARKLENGVIHFEAGLKSQLGNGELASFLDLNEDGSITGHCDIFKGMKLDFEAVRVV